MDEAPPKKKLKVDNEVDVVGLRNKRAAFLDSVTRRVSPPPGRFFTQDLVSSSKPVTLSTQIASKAELTTDAEPRGETKQNQRRNLNSRSKDVQSSYLKSSELKVLSSPIQLSKIQDLPASENIDSVGLSDILGDPLIAEAWIFDYCFDVDWLMQHFDADVRQMVQVKIVHGSWRREDMNKIMIDEACSRWPNVKAIQAYLPDAFGTHHSKMMVLFKHDDTAQVIIHTANMLAKDWTNMTQAVWRSPVLSLSTGDTQPMAAEQSYGTVFRNDLIRYMSAYGNKLKPLTQQIQRYEFQDVKAALVASVPSKFKTSAADDQVWGYEMLRRKLDNIRLDSKTSATTPHFVFQVSSIASLTSSWLGETLYSVCGSSPNSTSIIFPTAPDVAKSLDGYASGRSIHMKGQSAAHLKQIAMLRPQFCRWTAGAVPSSRAARDLAAPHIKTYIRFSAKPTKDMPSPNIDWALLTSANLSTQAWGSAPKLLKGENGVNIRTVHIQSYEIGVLVWPELFADVRTDSRSLSQNTVTMTPTFKKDTPELWESAAGKVVGLRMPYDLPLTPYTSEDSPWSPQSTYTAPDKHGRKWQ